MTEIDYFLKISYGCTILLLMSKIILKSKRTYFIQLFNTDIIHINIPFAIMLLF